MRHPFGSDTAVIDEAGNVMANAVGSVYADKTTPTPIADLLEGGVAVATITTDVHGEYQFLGPNDDTDQVWVDFGFGRFLARATDTEARVRALESAIGGGLGTGGGLPSGGAAGDFLRKQSSTAGDAQWSALTPQDIGFPSTGIPSVAKTGAYSDLSGKPTIPDAYTKVQSDARYPQTINGVGPDLSGNVPLQQGILVLRYTGTSWPSRLTVTNNTTSQPVEFRGPVAAPPPIGGSSGAVNDLDAWVLTP